MPQDKFRIAAVQMVSGHEVDANLADADRLIGEAAADGAQLVALPEYFPVIADEMAKVRLRERDALLGEPGPIQIFLAEAAKRHGVWLVGGTLPLEAGVPDKVRNSTLVFDPAGNRVARYDKIHLFGFEQGTERYNESRTIEPGVEVVSFDAPCGKVGLSVCYDLRFPELYRALAGQGDLTLIVVPAAFTEPTGEAHWELLLRARAVENQCYLLAAAQGGEHANGRRTWGDSMIIDPWGTVLARKPKGPGVVIADMDLERMHDIRTRLPALHHRTLTA